MSDDAECEKKIGSKKRIVENDSKLKEVITLQTFKNVAL